jgi:hypothetical protein
MHGLKDGPIRGVKSKNCNITTQRGLVLSNVQDPDLSGLKLKVASGDPIVHSDAVDQPDMQQ